MRFTLTYNQLFNIEADLKRLSKDAPGLWFLLNSKINLFFQRAAMDLKAMNLGIERIQRKYAEVDEKDKLVTGEDGNIKFKDTVIDGDNTHIGPEVEKAFLSEMNVLMSRSIVLDM